MPTPIPRNYFNAHCHLELSHLRGAILSGTSFVDWLRQLVRLKRSTVIEFAQAAVAVALNEMRANGTLALLDVDAMRVSAELLRAFPLPAISFTEIIEFDPTRAEAVVQSIIDYQAEVGPMNEVQTFGLSPHAPYTTTEALLRAAKLAADARNQWLCIHAAETEEEVQMFRDGRGDLHDLLREAKVLSSDWKAPRLRPVEYLAKCGVLGPRTLLVHLNHVTDDELKLLAATGTRAVVCPGTHVYFSRGEFPLARLLAAGIPTYLGTDSLASNESLDMAREVKLAQELCPQLDPLAVAQLADYKRAAEFGLAV